MLALLLAFLPSFLHVPLRRLMGQNISSTAKIRFGTFIRCQDLTVGDFASVGPGVYLSAKKIQIGAQSSIRGPTFMSCQEVRLGNNARISSLVIVRSEKRPQAVFDLGNCSSVFPMCWIEPGEGVVIEEQVSIGGFSLIFTHGVWPSYLDGGPMLRAPVRIGHHTYVPWKVFVLPGVDVGAYSVIGAGSVVNKSVPEKTLVGGVPAKVIRQPAFADTAMPEKKKRLTEILEDYTKENGGSLEATRLMDGQRVFEIAGLRLVHPDITLDLANYTASTSDFRKAGRLIAFLRQYGIRLNPISEGN